MRRIASLLFVLLSACAEPPTPAAYGSNVEPLDANGLPRRYSACVRQAAVKSAAIYDAYYTCKWELSYYIARLGGLSMEEKSALIDDMTKKALDYAHQQVVERHGGEAVRRTLQPPAPPAAAIVSDTDSQMKRWADCSVRALIEANSLGQEPAASIGHAKALCHHLWTGTPEAADRLYSKMLASVRAGPVNAPQWGPAEKQPGELRF